MSRIRCCLLVIFCLLLAVQVDGQDEIAKGKQALENATDFPWYDAKTDSFKQVPLQKTKTPGSTNRKSNWQQNPPTARKGGTGGRTANLGTGAGASTGFSGFFWVLVGMMLLLVIGLLVWAFLRVESEDTSQVRKLVKRNEDDEERIENLPFEIRRTLGTMFEEAKLAYESGNYREAMIYLFSHMLIEMDRAHWIHLKKAKTNGQYLAEIRANMPLKNIFRHTSQVFEDVFFGQREINQQQFESCWNSLPEFDSSLKQAAEST